MKNLNFLIKPASSLCNMRCRYCFYADEAASRAQASAGIMPASVSETLIAETFAALEDGGSVMFAFQGGEPTVAGLDYFRHFVQTVRAANHKRAEISYAIQTNGLALNGEWADFFAENRFLVGVSLDGDKAVHDEFRVDAAGKETWNRVVKNLALLQRRQVEVNALCVVTKRCAKSPAKVYRGLKKLGMRYLQFIPCLDPLDAVRGEQAYSLTPQTYGDFLCALFDEWYRDWQAGQYTSIRLFDDYVHLAMGLPAGTCATGGTCGAYFVAEGDGTLYPCDFYCLDTWKLGRVGDMPLEQLRQCETELRFLQEGLQHPPECAACQWQPLCNGGCKRDWYHDGHGNHNYLCPAFQRFFTHAAPRMQEIARAELLAHRTNQNP